MDSQQWIFLGPQEQLLGVPIARGLLDGARRLYFRRMACRAPRMEAGAQQHQQQNPPHGSPQKTTPPTSDSARSILATAWGAPQQQQHAVYQNLG